jgi:hypothetical protein
MNELTSGQQGKSVVAAASIADEEGASVGSVFVTVSVRHMARQDLPSISE